LLLDPDNPSVTLATLRRAASAVGRNLRVNWNRTDVPEHGEMVMPEIVLPRLYERDIDVLLQEELIFNGSVRALLAKALHMGATMRVHQCALSVVELTGETNLLANYSCDNRKGILLIENKIDAEFQPLQPERYRERAIRLMNEENCDVSCLLIAPRRYVESANQQQLANFGAIISYEDVATAIANEETPRSKHRSALILRAIEQTRRGYVLVPAPEVGSFWSRVYGIASAEFASLRMAAPSKKGSQSKWIIFKAGLPARITIDWKITAATVDLSFWQGALPKTIQALALPTLPANAALAQKGTTDMIRIPLSKPPADWIMMPDEQIREALRASLKLLEFFNNNRALLMRRG
jgi:hypothetical protein